MKLFMIGLMLCLAISHAQLTAMWCCAKDRKKTPHATIKTTAPDYTELLLAAQKNDTEACRDILTNALPGHCAALLGAQNNQGLTPLHIACANNNTELAILFLLSGTIVNKRDKEKRTPLYYAALCGNETIVQRLLEYGAVIDNQEATSPVAIAAARGHQQLISIFLALDGPLKTRFYAAKRTWISYDYCSVCKLFLDDQYNGTVIGFEACKDMVHLFCFQRWVAVHASICCPVCKKI